MGDTPQEQIVGQLEAALDLARAGKLLSIGLICEVVKGESVSHERGKRGYQFRCATPPDLNQIAAMSDEMVYLAGCSVGRKRTLKEARG